MREKKKEYGENMEGMRGEKKKGRRGKMKGRKKKGSGKI